ncbi:MAG: POTRA domain-containing protein [Kofleriaceae bacterium]
MMIAARVGHSKLLIGIALLAAVPAFRPTPAEPVLVVERIVIRGNARTRDKVIRRELGITETEPLGELDRVTRRLYALGYFTHVEAELRPGSSCGLVVLDISVIEMPRGSAAGFSSVENFIAEARMTQR